MKQFDFYTRWGHGDFKTFVEDYAKQFQARQAAGGGAAAEAAAGSAGSIATDKR